MWCMKCNRDLSECICEDLDERLKSLSNDGTLTYRKCLKCGKHYDLCKCENPEWGMSGKNEIVEKGDK